MSHRARVRLSVLTILLAAVLFFLSFHPRWEQPVGSGIMLAVMLVVAIARWFEQPWTLACAGYGAALAGGVYLLELALDGAEPWLLFTWATIFCSIAGTWSHHRWRRRPFLPAHGALRKKVGDDAYRQGSYATDNDAQPARRSWSRALRPRSRTSLFYALASLFAAMTAWDCCLRIGWSPAGIVVALPEVILALGLWFHQDWVRWFGVLLCLAWIAFLVFCWFLLGPEAVVYMVPLIVALLVLAWKFWWWTWENSDA